MLERILEGFVDGGSAGMGLGLAIAKQHVELHGEEISATGGVGAGSVFRFSVPDSRSRNRAVGRALDSVPSHVPWPR